MSVKNCSIIAGDDCIAGYDNYNFQMSGCELNTACNSLRFGCVNLLIDNCRFFDPSRYPHRISGRHNTLYAFEYYSHGADTVREGSKNWRIENCAFQDIDALIHYEFGNKEHLQESAPLEDITFINVKVSGQSKVSVLKGTPDAPVRMIFRNSRISLYPKQDADPACILSNPYSEIILENTAADTQGIPLHS